MRPLAAGAPIWNPAPLANVVGTLGMVWTDASGERWGISCYHVLCRGDARDPASQDEPVYQPAIEDPQWEIGVTDPARADATWDIAAIRIHGGVPSTDQVAALGAHTAPCRPRPGMEVLKVGYETDVTHGVIQEVRSPQEVMIGPGPSHPADLPLAAIGDSGAVWFESHTLAPVAVHTGMRWTPGGSSSVSRCLPSALRALNLR